MPSITVSYRDICRLLGKRVEQLKLCERLSMLGMEAEAAGDEIKLEITHNRPDLLSSEGVARALKGFLRIETCMPIYGVSRSSVTVEVDRSVETVRPYIAAGVVEGVKLTDAVITSLMQLQEKLHTSLCRNRRKGSIGVYDLDTINPPLRYTTTLPDGIRFIPLDLGQEMSPAEILHEHPKGIEYGPIIRDLPRFPLLIDSQGVVLSIPPIINSEDTRVEEDTKGLFIDVTGLDEHMVNLALKIMMTGLSERGFKLKSAIIKYPGRRVTTPDLRPRKFRLDAREVNRVIGTRSSPNEVAKIAGAMRYGVSKAKGELLTLLIPPYRGDIMHKIDIIEDIAIGYGYDNLELTIPKVLTVGERDSVEKLSDRARRVMTGLGFMEAMTYTLTNPRANFELMRVDGEAAEIANPVSEEYTMIRGCLLPSLLLVLKENRGNPLPQRVFEVGDIVVLDPKTEIGARNVKRVAAVAIGEDFGFTYIKAAAEALLRELGIEWGVRETSSPSFIGGRVAEFLVNGESRVIVGELHPEVIVGFELEHPVAAFELDLK